MHKNLQQQIDHLLQLQPQDQQSHLTALKHKNQAEFRELCAEIKNVVLSLSEAGLNIGKLALLEVVCRMDVCVDLGCFRGGCVYLLVAVVQGYMSNGHDVKGNFIRNLKRTPQFWGTTPIESLHQSLLTKSPPKIPTQIDPKSRLYLWQFIKKNQQLFPPNYDYYQYAIKHMFMLRPEKKEELEVFHVIFGIFCQYSYGYQVFCRNFRFVLEVFRAGGDGVGGFNPCEIAKRLIHQFPVYKVDNMFSIGSLGLSWTQTDVLNCINNVLKLGITESSYRLLKSFIQMFKRLKKYAELVQAFQKNMHKIFVFLKYPQLYAASLKTLKQFILGPWPVVSLYNIFTLKSTQFTKTKNLSQFQDLVFLLYCVIQKYKQSTLITDLQQLVKPFMPADGVAGEKIRAEILEYDWRVFENIGKKDKCDGKGKEKEEGCSYRGFVNIGNSCYINSFLQCLYMTKQYRRTVLETSTLNVQKIVLTKLQNLHGQAREGKNLALIARQTVRPLAELQRTFSLLLKSKRTAINPSNIKKISPVQFQNMNQHDCIQFGRFLIETISRSIEHVFEGEITTEILCPYCGAKRQKKEEFLDFMLSSSTNQDTENIEAMVQASLEDQYLQDLKCSSCNNTKPQPIIPQPSSQMQQQPPNYPTPILQPQKPQQQSQKLPQSSPNSLQSLKRHWISKYPKYLILTLKRFEYNITQNKNIKKQYKLDLTEIVRINDMEYMIYAFIVHRGLSANSGHYFTFARMSYLEEVKDWLCLNDGIVGKLEDFGKVVQFLNANQQDTPYIIFCINKQYHKQHQTQLQQPLTLRPPLQSFIQKDDAEYLKQMSNKGNNIDLSLLKFATGNYYRRDQDDSDGNGNGGNDGTGGFGNNPIM